MQAIYTQASALSIMEIALSQNENPKDPTLIGVQSLRLTVDSVYVRKHIKASNSDQNEAEIYESNRGQYKV